jgi:ABC-2 type transport system permease protein
MQRTVFNNAGLILATSIISQKKEGTWNRLNAAGVKPHHILTAHLIEGSIFCLIIIFEYSIYAVFVLYSNSSFQSSFLIVSIVTLTAVGGLLFGLIVSIVMRSVMGAFMLTQLFIFPPTLISGIFWPFQAVSKILQSFAYIFPFVYPVAALRRILANDSNISDSTVAFAIIMLFLWNSVLLGLCFWFIKNNENKQK